MKQAQLAMLSRTVIGVGGAVAGLLLIGFVVAALPEIFSIRLERVVLRLGTPLERIAEYVGAVGGGELFGYQAGSMSRNFLADLPPYWLNSFLFLFGGLSGGLTAGTFLGIIVARYDLRRTEHFIGSLGLVPDFLLAVLLQLLVIAITVTTGIRIARVASAGSHLAILLPLIVMTLYPAVAAVHIAADRIHHFRGEQFVVNLVARGIAPGPIYRRHLLPGVLDALKTELPRILGTHAATLFIVEQIFQSRGLVRWMFEYTFLDQGALQLGGYQYSFMVHCLIALITVVLASYALTRAGMALTVAGSRHA